MKKFLLIGIVLLLLHPLTSRAQQPRQYSFTHYTTTSGLLSDQVFTVVQDDKGYLWIGGTDGLQRYDGARYLSFRHNRNDSLSIPFNGIVQLIFDRKKRLWIYMADGSVGIFNTSNFTFQPIAVQPKDPASLRATERRIILDEQGHIFFLLFGRELLTFDENKKAFSQEKNLLRLPAGWAIADFAQQPGTQLYYIGVQGLGLAIFNQANGILSYPGHNTENYPAIDAFERNVHPNHMLFDQKGRLWFFCWRTVFPEVFCVNPKTGKYQQYELLTQVRAYNEIHGFFEKSDGSIWIKGLKTFARFLENENKFQLVYNGYTNDQSIAYETVTCLTEDREGNIWCGTNNNGLFRFNPEQEFFSNITHINRRSGVPGTGSPMSFIHTKWGTVLCGTWEDGLYQYDSNFNSIPLSIRGIKNEGEPFIWNMNVSPDSNTIWMAAQPGLFAIDQQQRAARYYNPAILGNATMRQIVEDRHGNLWLGMINGGLFKWKLSNGKIPAGSSPERYTAIPPQGIHKLMVDYKGWVWAATGLDGAYAIDPATDRIMLHFSNTAAPSFKIPEAGVTTLLEYNDSLVLIATANRLLVYNRIQQQLLHVGPADAMAGSIAALERDKEGFVWVTTSSGLYRVTLNRGLFVRYTREDGIQYDNFILAASQHLPDGRLVFGTSTQFIVFNPARMRGHQSPKPNMVITGFEVMNQRLSVDSILRLHEVKLSYKENSFTISFSPLIFSNAVLVKYKLEGLDKDWTSADKNLQATYPYLPSGTYTLRFQTMDSDGKLTDSDLSIIIRVSPPFWKAWWFYGLLALVAGGLLFWFDRERMKRKATLQEMRAAIAGSLHEEISSALSNINVLSEMARIKADREPEKSKEFIEQIHSKSGNMIYAMDDMLWSISPDNDSMGKIVDRMREYIDTLNSRHNAGIEMLVDEKVKSLNVSMQFRHEAFLLFRESIKELLNAGATGCKIYVILEKPHLVYTVQFNNEHCDMQQLYNLLQRQDMTRRLKIIKAKLDVQVNKTTSVFELRAPANG